MLAGVALYLVGIAFVDQVNEGATGDRAVSVRLGTAVVLLALAFLGDPLPPVFVALLTLALLALTVLEALTEDRPSLGGRR